VVVGSQRVGYPTPFIVVHGGGNDGLLCDRVATDGAAYLHRARPCGAGPPAAVRQIPGNASYTGIAYGNRQQTVPAKRQHPLCGGPTKGPGGESMRLRPQEEWIGVPVPALLSAEVFAQAQERLQRNPHLGDAEYASRLSAALLGEL